MAQITQLSPTPSSVITLGHSSKEPLIRPPSELGDGFEPHDLIYSAGLTVRGVLLHLPGTASRGGVPGVVQLGGYLGGAIPGTQPASRFRAYLMNYIL